MKRCARAAPGSRWVELPATIAEHVTPATIKHRYGYYISFAPTCECLLPQHVLLVRLYIILITLPCEHSANVIVQMFFIT